MNMQFLISFVYEKNYYFDPLFIELQTRTAESAKNQITGRMDAPMRTYQ